MTAWRNNGNGNVNEIYPKNTTNLDFQVVDHSLAEFYRNVFSNSVVEADDILGRLGIFGLQGDHHILVKLLKFTDMLSVKRTSFSLRMLIRQGYSDWIAWQKGKSEKCMAANVQGNNCKNR